MTIRQLTIRQEEIGCACGKVIAKVKDGSILKTLGEPKYYIPVTVVELKNQQILKYFNPDGTFLRSEVFFDYLLEYDDVYLNEGEVLLCSSIERLCCFECGTDYTLEQVDKVKEELLEEIDDLDQKIDNLPVCTLVSLEPNEQGVPRVRFTNENGVTKDVCVAPCTIIGTDEDNPCRGVGFNKMLTSYLHNNNTLTIHSAPEHNAEASYLTYGEAGLGGIGSVGTKTTNTYDLVITNDNPCREALFFGFINAVFQAKFKGDGGAGAVWKLRIYVAQDGGAEWLAKVYDMTVGGGQETISLPIPMLIPQFYVIPAGGSKTLSIRATIETLDDGHASSNWDSFYGDLAGNWITRQAY